MNRVSNLFRAGSNLGLFDKGLQLFNGYWNSPGTPLLVWNWKPKLDSNYSTSREPQCRLARLAERLGIDIAWEDEIVTCHDCGLAVSTTPAYYGDPPHYIHAEDWLLCQNCALDARDDVMDEFSHNDERALPPWFPLGDGWTRVDACEVGIRESSQDPEVIKADARALERPWVFRVASSEQFSAQVELWERVQ